MTIIVDTGVLYADHDRDATRHESAQEALGAVYDGEFGTPYVSDYIYDEAVTLTIAAARSPAGVGVGSSLNRVRRWGQPVACRG